MTQFYTNSVAIFEVWAPKVPKHVTCAAPVDMASPNQLQEMSRTIIDNHQETCLKPHNILKYSNREPSKKKHEILNR